MLDEQGVERQVAQNEEFAPTAICRGKFSTLFHLLITRVTRKGTNHESNLLARTIPKLVSQPRSEDTLSGIWDKGGRGCRRNSIT